MDQDKMDQYFFKTTSLALKSILAFSGQKDSACLIHDEGVLVQAALCHGATSWLHAEESLEVQEVPPQHFG